MPEYTISRFFFDVVMTVHILGTPGPEDGSNLEFASFIAPKVREILGGSVVLTVGEEQVRLDTVEKFDNFLARGAHSATPTRSLKMDSESEIDFCTAVNSAMALREHFGLPSLQLKLNSVELSVLPDSSIDQLKEAYLELLGFERVSGNLARIFPQNKMTKADLLFSGLMATRLTGMDVRCKVDRGQVLLKPEHEPGHINSFIYDLGSAGM